MLHNTSTVRTLTQHLSVGVHVCQLAAISNLFQPGASPLDFFFSLGAFARSLFEYRAICSGWVLIMARK